MKCALGMPESASLCLSLDLGVVWRGGGVGSVLGGEMKKISGEKLQDKTEISSSFSGF